MSTLSQKNPDDRRDPRRRHQIELRVLARAGNDLGSSLELAAVLRKAVKLPAGRFADLCLLYRLDDGRIHLASVDGVPSFLSGGLGAFEAAGVDTIRPIVDALLDGRSLLLNDVAENPELDGFADAMRTIGASSAMVVPAQTEQGVMGAMVFMQAAGAAGYDDKDFEIAQQLGRSTGQALLNAELYASQRKIAELFQRANLPRPLPSNANYRVDALYESATGDALLGGDWYDAFELPDGRVFLSLGDVLGHGIEAAVLMSKIRQSVRGAALCSPDVGCLMRIADACVKLEFGEAWATATIGIYAPHEHRLSLARAGHPAPICCNARGITVLAENSPEESSLPLGLWNEGDSARVHDIPLERGDTVAFFTDGLIEFSRDIYEGYGALYVAMRANGFASAANPAQFLRDTIVPETHADDIAIMTLSVF